MDTAFLLHLLATLFGMRGALKEQMSRKEMALMATTEQWLKMPFGQNGNAVGICTMLFGLLCQAGTLHALLCASPIAHDLSAPVSWEVPPSSG